MKKIISAVAALMMMCTMVSTYAEGTYTASDWAKEELLKAEELKIIPDALMDKDLREDITRAEFAAVSVKLYENMSGAEAETIAENPFKDTEDEEILKAYNLGITTGTSETEFSPEALLNREQAAAMLTRVYKKVAIVGWSIENDADFKLEYEAGEKFADDENISDWAKDSVYFMAAKGVINGVGDNKFAPKNITEEEKTAGYANASREQALLMAVRMTDIELPHGDGTDPDPYKGDHNNPADVPDPYGGQEQNPEENDGENVYTAAFIGGSLTEGGQTWIAATKAVLQEKMPDKEVVTINAGKGGTGSAYGALRFMEDVGKYNPDIVFIEFAVNDTGIDEKGSSVYMESMLRQCMKLSKEPVVVFLQTPQPAEIGSDLHTKWITGAKVKEAVAAHYGIKSINIYDYMQEDYENVKEEKGYETFTDYLSQYYQGSGSGFNVHGGYAKYAEAIVKEFTDDYEGCMKVPNASTLYRKEDKKLVEATYTHIPINSPRMKYTGKWDTYTAESPFQTDDGKASINGKHYRYPFFTEGIKQAMNTTAAFGFETKAEAFCLNYPAASAGSSVKVYIDSVEVGTLSCYSQYHAVNYTTNFISLPNDGKTHKVIMVVDRPSADNYVFRFGTVVERYAK